MIRMSLDGRILEVNLVFEMVTGFNGVEMINTTPCNAPLYGSLSVMPKSFLRYFSTVSQAAGTNPLNAKDDNDGSSTPSLQLTARSQRSPAPPRRCSRM